MVAAGATSSLATVATTSLVARLLLSPAKCRVSCNPVPLLRVGDAGESSGGASGSSASGLQCDPIGPSAIFDTSSTVVELGLLGVVMSRATVGLPTLTCQLSSGTTLTARLPSVIVPDFIMVLLQAESLGSGF